MKTWQRRTAIALGSVAGLLVLVLGGVYGMSARALGDGHVVTPHPFSAANGNAEEGRRLTSMYGCTDCHGPDLGGQVIVDEMPFARVSAPNLTAGRDGGPMTDEEFERALRHGIGTKGTKLFIMPSSEYMYLSDQDVADIKAYIGTVAPVERDVPARAFGPIGRMLTAMGKVPFQPDLIAADPDARHLEKPAADQPERLGYYLTRMCIGCHGPQLAGAPAHTPGNPPGANLTPAGNLRNWTFDDFRNTLSTGRTPEGKQLDPMVMPWTAFAEASDEEKLAIWTYLRTLPPVESTATEH